MGSLDGGVKITWPGPYRQTSIILTPSDAWLKRTDCTVHPSSCRVQCTRQRFRMEYTGHPQSAYRLQPRLIIHGGAGNIIRDRMPPEEYEAYRHALLSVVGHCHVSVRHLAMFDAKFARRCPRLGITWSPRMPRNRTRSRRFSRRRDRPRSRLRHMPSSSLRTTRSSIAVMDRSSLVTASTSSRHL